MTLTDADLAYLDTAGRAFRDQMADTDRPLYTAVRGYPYRTPFWSTCG